MAGLVLFEIAFGIYKTLDVTQKVIICNKIYRYGQLKVL